MKAKIPKPLRESAEIVDPTTLDFYPMNPRRGDVGAIVESLETNGQYRPLVVNRRNRQKTVLAGNHTLRAVLDLGWDEVAVTYISVDDAAAARIVAVDNRTNDLATYDDTELVRLLSDLADSDLGLAGTGFDGDDLDDLVRNLAGHSGGEGSWDGMPDFEQEDRQAAFSTTIHFPSHEDADRFFEHIERKRVRSMWWPASDGHIGSDRDAAYIADE